jgi:hypothetical protein
MDLGGSVVMDAGASELGLLGGGSSRLLKHGRGPNAAGGDDDVWGGGRAKQPRTGTAPVVAGDVAAATKAAAAPFLLGSCSPGHGGEQMLSFSSAAAAAAASCASSTAAADGGGAMPLYYGTPASCSGEREHGDGVPVLLLVVAVPLAAAKLTFFSRCLLIGFW